MSVDALKKPGEPGWGGKQWSSHTWMEPVIVVGIMVASCYLNRRKDFPIFHHGEQSSLLDDQSPRRSFEGSESSTSPSDYDSQYDLSAKYASKRRNCCGLRVYTPNSSRFAQHWHSRILQKFPFLVEMFYWILNYAFYSCTKFLAAQIFSTDGLWDTAEAHGIRILDIEHKYWTSIFFPLSEVDVQRFFMNGHVTLLTVLNRAYSLIHIPGTVAFISWYYYAAPSHNTFTTVRRTMTLCNFLAFTIFIIWPCMPPRLLPAEFGFHDTVRHSDANSVFMEGKYVNQLAAMPSLHFAYAFCIGCTLLYHSGLFRRNKSEFLTSKPAQIFFVAFGVCYPIFLLTVIVATANHYWLDALAATFVGLFAFTVNRVFLALLPLEDIFLWCMRLEKPVPTTGENSRPRKRDSRPLRQEAWTASAV